MVKTGISKISDGSSILSTLANRSRLIICGKGRMTLGESPTRVRKFFFAEFFLRETPAMDLVFFQANIMEI